MSDACYLSPESGLLISAEKFLSAIDRDAQFSIRLDNGSVRYFGYCQGCRNKVLHGQFTRNGKTVQFFRHHAALYNLAELQRMEVCGWYEPDNGRDATAAVVRDDMREAVFNDLRANAYGIWRTINAYILKGIGKISKRFFMETVDEILSQRHIASGFGFSSQLLPFYILSQIEEGKGTQERYSLLKRRQSIWLNSDPVPNKKWSYVHFSLLSEYRRRNKFGVRFLKRNRSNAPTLLHEIECEVFSVNGTSYLAVAMEFEREAEKWLSMSDKEFIEQYPGNTEVLSDYKLGAQEFRQRFRR